MERSIDSNQTVYHFNPVHLTIYLVFTIPLWFSNVLGNVLVLLCVYREKQLRRPSYYLIAALSLADIAFPVLGYIPTTYKTFVKTRNVCHPVVQFYLTIPSATVGFASFVTLITLTIERYLSVAFPVYHRKNVTTRRVLALVSFHWILSICATAVDYPFSPSNKERLYCVPFQFAYLVITLSVGISGLTLLSLLNAHLLTLIRRRLRKDADRNRQSRKNNDAQPRSSSMNAKACKAVSTVVIFFVICWLPVIVFLLLEAVNYKRSVNYIFIEVGRRCFSVAFLINGAINPIVYARQNPQLRSAFGKLLGRKPNQVGDLPDDKTTNTAGSNI